MKKETKIEIVKDIITIKKWFKDNNLMKLFSECIENLGQLNYSSETLFLKTLMNKNKMLLDIIREKTLNLMYEN